MLTTIEIEQGVERITREMQTATSTTTKKIIRISFICGRFTIKEAKLDTTPNEDPLFDITLEQQINFWARLFAYSSIIHGLHVSPKDVSEDDIELVQSRMDATLMGAGTMIAKKAADIKQPLKLCVEGEKLFLPEAYV